MIINFKEKLLKGEFITQVNEAIHGEIISNSKMIHNIIAPIISYDADREHFCTFYLSSKNQINHMEISFIGSLSSCFIYPREIIKTGLFHKAAAMIFVHNHPSGHLEISQSDLKLTKKLLIAASVFDITVHDHLIINESSYLSLASEGFLEPIKRSWDAFMSTEITE